MEGPEWNPQDYAEKQAAFIDNFEGGNSNEGIFQFAINVPEKNTRRSHASKQELARFANEWVVKDVALDLRILRKKNVWYGVLTELAKQDSIKAQYVNPTNLYRRGENYVLRPELFIGMTNHPLLRWFGNLVEHLNMKDLSSRNISLNSTIGDSELHFIKNSHIEAQRNFVDVEALVVDLNLITRQSIIGQYGLEHIMRNTINGLCVDFAYNNNMFFSTFHAKYEQSNMQFQTRMNSHGTITGTTILKEHNALVKAKLKAGLQAGAPPSSTPSTPQFAPSQKPSPMLTPVDDTLVHFDPHEVTVHSPSIETISHGTMYDAIFGKTADGVSVEKPLIPLDILLDAEAIVESKGEKDPEAEEGWEELAREVLTKAGLDISQYGLSPKSKTPPPTDIIPETPPSQTGISPSIHNTYRHLAINEHNHPPVDANDIADATDTAIREYEHNKQTGENLEGGEFIISPAQFTSDMLQIVAPGIITPYNDTPPDQSFYLEAAVAPIRGYWGDPEEYVQDLGESKSNIENYHVIRTISKAPPEENEDRQRPSYGHEVFSLSPDRETTPPPSSITTPNPKHNTTPPPPDPGSPIEPPSTPALRLPSISEVLPSVSPTLPPSARVHHNPDTCNKIADAFIQAWRMAKAKVYSTYKTRHFNINHGLFRAGAVCHRCYQLVRRHHEHYHLHSGSLVDRTKLAYPRKRRDKQRDSIRENKHSKVYKDTRAKAKKYTKKLVSKNASQLRKYNKKLK